MVTVFLSHSSNDKPFVRELADALESGGEIKVWLDEREIDYGENAVLKMEEDTTPTSFCSFFRLTRSTRTGSRKNGPMPIGIR